MPQVSLIVPVYNVQRFIERCAISILQQSFTDFEAIFVDDCSTDCSAAAVRRLARNDARIVLVSHNENRGLGAARNTGLDAARSDYITFLDSDDFVDANLLEEMLRASDGGHFDIVETGFRAIDEDDNVLWDYTPAAERIEDLQEDPEHFFRIREFGMTQKLWRARLLREGPRQPEGMYWEDIAIVPSLFSDARNLARAPYAGYNYLQRQGSISNSRSLKLVVDLFRAFELHRAHLLKRNLLEKHQKKFVRHVNICVAYLSDRLRSANSGETGGGDSLARLCEELRDIYLRGGLQIEALGGAEFEAALSQACSQPHSEADLGKAIARLSGR